MGTLSITDHRRDLEGLTYIYPVFSRRASGLSLGVNLNPNHACNWRCIYCQVPQLRRGTAPPLDMERLAAELEFMLRRILAGEFRNTQGRRLQIKDISISGDGESTTSREFPQVVHYLGTVLAHLRTNFNLTLPLRLITNGSMLHRSSVQEAISEMGTIGGEVWFKVDAGRPADFVKINDVPSSPADVSARLSRCATLCPTWVQSCFFRLDGQLPDSEAISAYLQLLQQSNPSQLRGVLLYSLARPSQQVEAPRLTALTARELAPIAQQLRRLGLAVKVTP